jgi:putative addiction module component (TIGR02574 family)
MFGNDQETKTSSSRRAVSLVEDLWDSIAADQQVLRFTAEQRIELDRRLDAYEAGKNRGRLAADAVADIRQKL